MYVTVQRFRGLPSITGPESRVMGSSSLSHAGGCQSHSVHLCSTHLSCLVYTLVCQFLVCCRFVSVYLFKRSKASMHRLIVLRPTKCKYISWRVTTGGCGLVPLIGQQNSHFRKHITRKIFLDNGESIVF